MIKRIFLAGFCRQNVRGFVSESEIELLFREFLEHFTFSLPGVYCIHLQLNLRETLEPTSLYEGWDHNITKPANPSWPEHKGPWLPASLRNKWQWL
uniref:Uncharacterized protein n=1 Tax=Cyanoderma ruficeps TaxID=181631 RepID=A0A8C3QZF3_9PASS